MAEQGKQDGPSIDDSQPRSSHLPVLVKQPPAAPDLTAAMEAPKPSSAQKAAKPPSARKAPKRPSAQKAPKLPSALDAAAVHTATSAEGEALLPVRSVHSAKHTRSGSYTILQDTVQLHHDCPVHCPTQNLIPCLVSKGLLRLSWVFRLLQISQDGCRWGASRFDSCSPAGEPRWQESVSRDYQPFQSKAREHCPPGQPGYTTGNQGRQHVLCGPDVSVTWQGRQDKVRLLLLSHADQVFTALPDRLFKSQNVVRH